MCNSPKSGIGSSAQLAIVALSLFTGGYGFAESHDALAPLIEQSAQANDPVSVSISPLTINVATGAQQQFTVTVAGTTNKNISWTIVGSGCTGSACGTITASGLYTAPAAIPSPPLVVITATSQADPTKSSTAFVTIVAPIQVSVRPAKAEVLVGGHQQFTAVVSGTSNTVVLWSLSGAGCKGASCGLISSSGLYTAPAVAPNPSLVTVTATSTADSSKSGSAAVTVTGPVSIFISPKAANAVVGSSQQFSAIIKGTTDTRVTWNVAGTGCSEAACGTVSPNGLYFAPPSVPSPAQVFITVTSVVDPTKSDSAALTVLSPISVTITPPSATVVTGAKLQFSAAVNGSANQSVIWSLNAGCSATACGTISSTGLYTAPPVLPAQPVVIIKAAAAIDPNVYHLAKITLVPPVTVKVNPPAASLVVNTSAQFKATVTGSANQSVAWSITGAGCSGKSCGTITSNGIYTAPASVPTPPVVTVTATSTLNTAGFGSATVTILPPVGIQVSPAGIEVVTGRQQQFVAKLTGTTNTNVAWSVSGPGCTGSACGTISSTGLYTAPAVPPKIPQVLIKATSVADITKSSFATVTVISPVDVTISPTSSVAAVNGKINFRANVIGSDDETVLWSLSGVGCSASSCGTLDTSGLYTAPGKIPPLGIVIVTATSHIDPSASVSAIVSIVGSNNAKLAGSYVFQFTGFDASGVHDSAGVFRADGKGNIVSGIEDVNSTSGPTAAVPLTGTYSIGSDNRGVLVFNNSGGQQTFRFALNQASSTARCIEYDSSGVLASGVFMQQDSSALGIAGLKGGYAVSLVGQDNNGARIGALSMLYLDGSGDVVGGTMDVNDNGILMPTFVSLAGSYAVDGSGHGSLQLNVPGFFGGMLHYALAVASSGQFFLVSTDPAGSANPIAAGRAMRQQGVFFSQSSLNGGTIFSVSGGSGIAPEVMAGRVSFDGISTPWMRFDQNVAGTITTGNVVTGAYSVGVNGVGIVNLDNSDGSTRDFIAYVYAPDSAFLMDASTSAVDMGELSPQTVRTPYTTRDLQGRYMLGSGQSQSSTATVSSGTLEFDGMGAQQGAVDINQSGSLTSGQGVSGPYQITAPLFGRAAVDFTAPANSHFLFWVAGPDEAVGFEADPSATHPVVLYLEQ